jgi:hypothetical protein
MSVAIKPQPGASTRTSEPPRRPAVPRVVRPRPVSAETLRRRWSVAFDAAQAALLAGRLYLPIVELRLRCAQLRAEREPTRLLLEAFARDERRRARVL